MADWYEEPLFNLSVFILCLLVVRLLEPGFEVMLCLIPVWMVMLLVTCMNQSAFRLN